MGVGDRVWIESFRREGEILTIDEGRDQVRVQIGDFIYTMDLTAVEPLAKSASGDAAKSEASRKHKYAGYVEQTSDVGPEVSLRGLSACWESGSIARSSPRRMPASAAWKLTAGRVSA